MPIKNFFLNGRMIVFSPRRSFQATNSEIEVEMIETDQAMFILRQCLAHWFQATMEPPNDIDPETQEDKQMQACTAVSIFKDISANKSEFLTNDMFDEDELDEYLRRLGLSAPSNSFRLG